VRTKAGDPEAAAAAYARSAAIFRALGNGEAAGKVMEKASGAGD